MQYIGALEAAEKHIPAKSFKKICTRLYGSSRFSATIFAEPCRKNPADVHRFAKIENIGTDWWTKRGR